MIDKKANINLCLLKLSGMKIIALEFHVYDSNQSRYDMILGRDIITDLGL